jgi:hypothetical protein
MVIGSIRGQVLEPWPPPADGPDDRLCAFSILYVGGRKPSPEQHFLLVAPMREQLRQMSALLTEN